MASSVFPNDDWSAMADGLESVSVIASNDATRQLTTKAFRRPLLNDRSRQSTGDRLSRAEVAWRLPTSDVTSAPRVGDVIEDEQGERWTVLHADHAPRIAAWRCHSRNVVAYFALNDFVDIEVAEVSTDASGVETMAWHSWRTGVAARFGDGKVDVVSDRNEPRVQETGTLFLAEPLVLDHAHRIRRYDGRLFRALHCEGFDRPGEPTEVAVAPWNDDEANS